MISIMFWLWLPASKTQYLEIIKMLLFPQRDSFLLMTSQFMLRKPLFNATFTECQRLKYMTVALNFKT
ncbi:hypothetical protein MAR_008525 [Mya arenaria]|uniref:Uncharacterized protein n=1 Tax=Mya arenaria TaxID=6604 RepID=A0ABY7DYU4_MYAAR|nr:hypothetical protein MAR_008525 [Mya arenaria]